MTATNLPSLEARLNELLQHVGDPATCRGCGRAILWVKHRNGKAVPYTLEGYNHFIDCPRKDQFKRA